MSNNRYHLMAGQDLSRRIHHGSFEAAVRACTRLGYEDPETYVLRPVDELVVPAFQRLEATGHCDLVEIGREGILKHGWLEDYCLYAALCGAASIEYESFVPECEDLEDAEFMGWRWGIVGHPTNSMLYELCDLIADIVLRPEKLKGRDLATEARIPQMFFPSTPLA